MKLHFKIIFTIFLILSNAHARDIVVVSYNDQLKQANVIKQLIIEKIKIPSKLVSIKYQEDPCHKIAESIMQFCIQDDGTLSLVNMQRNMIAKSFGTFLKEEN